MNDTDNPPVSTRDEPDVPEETGRFSVAALFASCAWFRALAAGHQELVLATSHAEYRESGAWVAHRGAPSDYWIEVLDLAKLSAYGREQM